MDSTLRTQKVRPIAVTVFVDWNSQIHNVQADKDDPHFRARQTLKKTARAVCKMLLKEAPRSRFDVYLRLYHGWHKGWERTENFRAIMDTIADQEFPIDYSERNVLIRQTVKFGHTLLSALPERQHEGHQIHFGNTLRGYGSPSRLEEKMVDTALAADLLQWARESPSEWALVLAEDDDIVPPVFTAEAWVQAHGGRMFIVRSRASTQYIKLDGILRGWMS